MSSHSLNSAVRISFLLLLAATLSAGRVGAQGTTPGYGHGRPLVKYDTSEVVTIRKLAGAGRQALQKTPDFRTRMPAGVKPLGDWVEIAVTYDTGPKWIDELVFQFYVLTSTTTENGKKAFSVFKTTVKYTDIERARDHLSAVYLRPSIVKRYGYAVAAAVEISGDGKVLAAKTLVDNEVVPLEDRWWADGSKVMKSPNVTVRDGYLLDRSQTPFALVNVDDYEVSK